jgi:AraC-like DNA-binding protein
MYLTKGAIMSTLRQSHLRMALNLSCHFYVRSKCWTQQVNAQQKVPAPMALRGLAEEIMSLAYNVGFKKAEHFSSAAMTEHYFANSVDGLRPPNNSEELLIAMT